MKARPYAPTKKRLMSSLKNRIAVVTGGSSGIGLATAKRFLDEGAHELIAGRRKADLDRAVAEIGENMDRCSFDDNAITDAPSTPAER